jgi:hypothetical protein
VRETHSVTTHIGSLRRIFAETAGLGHGSHGH